ncbi:MAG: hypothetical protein [Cotesia congregata filamentous virus 2]
MYLTKINIFIFILEFIFFTYLWFYFNMLENNFFYSHFYNTKEECVKSHFKYSPHNRMDTKYLSLVGINRESMVPFLTIYDVEKKIFKEHLNISPIEYSWNFRGQNIVDVGNSKIYDTVKYKLNKNNTELIVSYIQNKSSKMKEQVLYINSNDDFIKIYEDKDSGMFYLKERTLCDNTFQLNEYFSSTYTHYLKYASLYDYNIMSNNYDDIIIQGICIDKDKFVLNTIIDKKSISAANSTESIKKANKK